MDKKNELWHLEGNNWNRKESIVINVFLLLDACAYFVLHTSYSPDVLVIFKSHNCSGSEQDQILSGVGVVWPTLMIASSAFQAVASILKVMNLLSLDSLTLLLEINHNLISADMCRNLFSSMQQPASR